MSKRTRIEQLFSELGNLNKRIETLELQLASSTDRTPAVHRDYEQIKCNYCPYCGTQLRK
jgi:hypothetical protein